MKAGTTGIGDDRAPDHYRIAGEPSSFIGFDGDQIRDRGGQRAAAMYTLIVTAKLNDIDPQAWLADVLARIADHPVTDIDALLPWNWKTYPQLAAA